MKDPVKLLTKDYFHRHPIKEHSAARFVYSLLLMPEVLSSAKKALPELREQAAQRGIYLPDSTQQMALLEQEEDMGNLLRMLRQSLTPDICAALLEKLLNREAEALPEIQRLVLKTLNANAIESCTRFMAMCEANCSEWVLQNYDAVREPYARSMLCLVLGFRGDRDVIPFLMQQVELFERQFPGHSFEQAPLLALYEIPLVFGRADTLGFQCIGHWLIEGEPVASRLQAAGWQRAID